MYVVRHGAPFLLVGVERLDADDLAVGKLPQTRSAFVAVVVDPEVLTLIFLVALSAIADAISKFALRDAQGDDTHALLRVSTAEMPRLPRDQSWDQESLLCGDCEERRRRWEEIVAPTISGRGDGREPRPVLYVDEEHPDHLVRAEQVPYGPVKLWVLSTQGGFLF